MKSLKLGNRKMFMGTVQTDKMTKMTSPPTYFYFNLFCIYFTAIGLQYIKV